MFDIQTEEAPAAWFQGLLAERPGAAGATPDPLSPEAAGRTLAGIGAIRTTAPRQRLNADGRTVSLILEGAVLWTAGDTPVCLGVASRGWMFGLEAASARGRKVSGMWLTQGRVFEAPASAFSEVLGWEAAHGLLARQASARMAQLEQEVVCNATHAVPARLGKWLWRLRRATGSTAIPLTQKELAEMAGVQRTSANAAMQKLKAAGAVRCARGRIHILDDEALHRFACPCENASSSASAAMAA
jgi:CRP-like cAMP-binding protein